MGGWRGLRTTAWRLGVWAWWCVSLCGGSASLAAPPKSAGAAPTTAHPAAAALAGEAATVARWVQASDDAGGRPYALVDKKVARIAVFDGHGHLLGVAPVLLGQAPGDDDAPATTDRAQAGLRPSERTTPAGRFASEPGVNDRLEAIVWIDYHASLAIHRLRPGPTRADRLRRLASPLPADHRASAGCVVVSPAFYDAVIAPTLGRRAGVVYLLPETRSLAETFGRDGM